MKPIALVFAVIIFLSGCSSAPKEPIRPNGEVRVPVNSASAIAESMGGYYRKLRLVKLKSEPKKVTTRLTIKKVLDQYVPAEFTAYPDGAIDLSTVVEYETGRPWPEALGDALSEVDIDMTADLSKRVMTLKPAKLTVARILEKYVPAEFTVFADEAVNMNATTAFDRSQSWTEALGKALLAAGINSTVNLSKKLIVLKPRIAAHQGNEAEFNKSPAPTSPVQK